MDSATINGHSLQAEDIKRQAAGRWREILPGICGISPDILNGRHHPCPKCGGTDRFRALDDFAETGGVFCNQCFSTRNGDGFAAVQWLRGVTFNGALKLVADAIGQTSNGHHKPANKQASKAKTVHESCDKAADAIVWGMVQSGILTRQRKPDAAWRYRNADGSDAGSVLRWNLPDDRKEIRQVSCVPGGWITSAMPEPRCLYRLPEIIDAAEVWICEGEKAADAAVSLGLVATCSAGGSSAAEKTDWRTLDGKRVYILPDNDSAGEKYAAAVVELIGKQSPNATIEVKRLSGDWPNIPEGGDVFDWQEQFDTADAETLKTRLQDLPDRIAEYDIEQPDEPKQEPRIDFEIVDSKAFAESDYRTEFLIDGIMTEGQPKLYGGPSKTLKTSILVDQVLSLAAAEPFLGQFNVPNAKRCLLLSSESGTATLQETARRICQTKGIDLAKLGGQLHWGFRPTP